MPTMRRLILPPLVFGLVFGCNGLSVRPRPPAAPEDPVANPPPAATDAQTKPAVMAMVNGRPIYMDRLYEVLLDAHGMQMAWQLVATELVRQELQRSGASITEADVLAENDRTLAEVFGEGFKRAERERLLGQLLQRRGISRRQWDLTISRNAMLRKLAEPLVKITEKDLADQFAEQFGRKVVVRHIQTESLAQAQMVLEKLQDPKADFAKLARKYSRNSTAKRGGRLPAIGPLTPPEIPAVLRRAALAMAKVGRISRPVKVGTAFHILKLEKVVAPRAEKFEAVKDKLRASIHARRVHMIRQRIHHELLAKADVVYTHPALRDKQQEPGK